MARAMKDSGIAWIGEIPEEWTIERGKNILKLLERPVQENDGVITCFRDGEVTLRSKRREEGFTISLQEAGYQGIEPGDLVVHGMDGFAGAIGISDSRGKGTPVLNVMDSSQSKRYLMYYLRCAAYCGLFLSLATGIRVRSCDTNWNKLKNILYILPPLEEQRKIVRFLDSECARIDAVIEQTQASIEEYKKLKQAVITQAVTKGIRPNRPMKEVYEFEASIPDSWAMVRLKYLTTEIVDCPHETPEYSNNGEYLVIRTADQDYARLRPDESMYRLDLSEYQNRIRRLSLDRDDIVYGREGERWGLACLVPESGKYCLGQRMMQFRCDESRILPMFAVYALSSIYVHRQGEFDTFGSTSPHVNISTIRNYKLPLPPLGEQEEIQSYLDRKSAEIDDIIAKKERYLSEVQSFKKSLIFEYVTGKKEV